MKDTRKEKEQHQYPLYNPQRLILAGLLTCILLFGYGKVLGQAPVLLTTPELAGVKHPVFRWQPSAGHAVSYSLRVVECLPHQSASAALQANPAWFEIQGLQTTQYTYPLTAPALREGHRYVWQITAEVKGLGPDRTSSAVYVSEPGDFALAERPNPAVEIRSSKKKKKEEEESPPATYAHLHTAPPSAVHYAVGKRLGIQYEKRYGMIAERELSVRIADAAQPWGDALTHELTAQSIGDNRYSVPIDYLAYDQLYRLETQTREGRVLYLHFKRVKQKGEGE